jgi:hypothetical protein
MKGVNNDTVNADAGFMLSGKSLYRRVSTCLKKLTC